MYGNLHIIIVDMYGLVFFVSRLGMIVLNHNLVSLQYAVF